MRWSGVRGPVVLFSPGSGVSRPLYSGLAADLASHGYLVAVLDHPGEDQPVEFPDGSVVPPVPVDSEEALAALVPVRMADIRTALGLLARLDAEPGARMHNALNLGRVALAGHSFGGAVAAEAMRLDRRVRAGVNLDGTMLGRVVNTGLDRPFLLVGSDGHEEQDPTWASFRARSPQTTTLEIAGAAHLDFTDLPALFAFRSPDEPRELLQIGPIDPRRSTKIQTAYVRAFLDRHLRGNRTSLLDGPSRRYPEVALLARYSGRTLDAYRDDLRGFLQRTTDNELAVLAATRPHVELYRSWMAARGLAASTIDRRLSTVCRPGPIARLGGAQ